MGFPRGDKKMSWHEVWAGITATSFTQIGDMGEVGGPLKRAITINGTKIPDQVELQRKKFRLLPESHDQGGTATHTFESADGLQA
jgi:hypothetical protein